MFLRVRGGGEWKAFYARVLRQMSLLPKIPPPLANPQSSPRNLSFGIYGYWMYSECKKNFALVHLRWQMCVYKYNLISVNIIIQTWDEVFLQYISRNKIADCMTKTWIKTSQHAEIFRRINQINQAEFCYDIMGGRTWKLLGTVQCLKQFLHTVNTVGEKGEIFPQPAWLPAFLAI